MEIKADATIKDVLTKIEAAGVKVDIVLRNSKTYQVFSISKKN
ncbi:MAG: hypothetical protein ACETWM_01820 [Candidatus Lokiarchaeia archaeon]